MTFVNVDEPYAQWTVTHTIVFSMLGAATVAAFVWWFWYFRWTWEDTPIEEVFALEVVAPEASASAPEP
ncbi:hypothetical protein BXZ70DRAFT_1064278 [Cristinia sonorae]|uniref:Uncharacterized protein n=1 Tax=Cristinia sonorae TaxID=1940300 RepID=A0A8K0UPG2_9AGAR|nr:hypothetical protein BXZ70DRAFT_1064278 [Cristinia sonorae]